MRTPWHDQAQLRVHTIYTQTPFSPSSENRHTLSQVSAVSCEVVLVQWNGTAAPTKGKRTERDCLQSEWRRGPPGTYRSDCGIEVNNELSPAASAADNLQPDRRSRGATSVVTRYRVEGRGAKGNVPGWHAGVRQCQHAAQSLLSTQRLTQLSTKEASTGEATLYRVRDSKPAGLIDKHGCRQGLTSPATNVPSNGFGVFPDYLLGPLIGAKPTHGTHV